MTFEPEDGGERCETNLPSGAFEYHKLKDYFVTYAAYPGETPILSGGILAGTWAEEDGTWVAPVIGVTVENLVADGRAQPLARTPNEGYYTVPETAQPTRAFRFRPGELRAWPDMEDNRIIMLLRWHTGINSIARIDEEQRMAHLRGPQEGIRVVPPRYYVENVRALLDAPGEWCFDRKTNRLSYLPANGLQDPNSARMVVPVLNRLIAVEGLLRRSSFQ